MSVFGLIGCIDGAVDGNVANGGYRPNQPAAQPKQPVAAPLTGSSMTVLSTGRLAIADPDADVVHVVETGALGARPTPFAKLSLSTGSRPTRIAAMADGTFAVILRGRGEVLQVSAEAKVIHRTTVCPEPRGIAYDSAAGLVKVACNSGELVSVNAAGAAYSMQLGEELRDVLMVNGTTWVTTFRSAQLLELDASQRIVTRLTPPTVKGVTGKTTFTPHVAWRSIVNGSLIVMAHQLELVEDVSNLAPPTSPIAQNYGRLPAASAPECLTSVVSSALTIFDTQTRQVRASGPIAGSLPIDLVADSLGYYSLNAGGNSVVYTPLTGPTGSCFSMSDLHTLETPTGLVNTKHGIIALAGSSLYSTVGRVDLTPPVNHHARAEFHAQSPSGVACASCHAEGYDDGHVWTFDHQQRRTQSLEGGLLETAPFHWKGELPDIASVLHSTLEIRMGGTLPIGVSAKDIGDWLETIPSRKPLWRTKVTDTSRGQAIFAQAGCGSCHSGPAFTNNRAFDVGTGGTFQVPSLRALRFRGPWMHDGCAATLAQRFTPECGGKAHSQVDAADVPELVKYLETL